MTETVLDQFQKLFGKGFLIAAFVPSMLFVCFVKFLRAGWWEMQMGLSNLWSAGWKISLNVLAYLVIIYLLAYVIYGVRGLLHNLFQGQWHITLSAKQQYNEAIILPDWALTDLPIKRQPKPFVKWLEVILNLPFTTGRRWETRSFRNLNEISELRVSVLNIPRWILKEKFDKTFNAIKLDHDHAVALIEKVDANHRDFLKRFWEGEHWKESEYWDILATAQLLRANRGRLKDAQTAIDGLINDIKEVYFAPDSDVLRQAVENFAEAVDREWRSIYSHLKATFPEEERWMRPTRLGNIAMVQELAPMKRYGINLSAIWPRLMHVLPPEARQRLEDANIYVDFTVIMSLLAFVSGGVAIYNVFHGPTGRALITRVLLIVACFAAFWIFYQLAIQATRGFGIEIQSAVDAYRLKLLDQFGLQRPGSAEEEQRIWTELRYFISQGDLPTEGVRVKTVAKAEEKEKPGGPSS